LTKIPAGKVVTYQQVIVGIGVSQGYFRALPKYLQKAIANGYPAHRVLDSQGNLTPHITNQRERLAAEGVRVIDSCVVLDNCLWNDPTI
jgi:alkylated DNA nucleotide flippase Atl1